MRGFVEEGVVDASSIGSKPDVAREEFAQLVAEVRELSRRVSALEGSRITPPYEAPPLPRAEFSSDLVPAIGKALLAIAGAYLLRALTEFRIAPPAAGVAAGIVYAAAWLAVAMRSRSSTAARVYATASMLILGPLLWEACTNFHAMPMEAAALLIALFAIAPSRRIEIAPITCTAGAAIATVFLVRSHDLAPFSLAILAIAATAEYHNAPMRWLVALFADLAVAIFTIVMIRGVPEGYPPVSIRAALISESLLVVIYAAGLLARRRAFLFLEIAQAACALLIGAGGALYLTKSTISFAVILLAASTTCYAFAFFIEAPERNRRTVGGFALALAVGGSYLLISGTLLVALWSSLAVLFAFARAAAFHSWIYLWCALLVSGAAVQVRTRLWEETAAPFTLESTIILIGGVAAYFVLARAGWIWPALVTAASTALLLAALASHVAPAALVLTLFAPALAWCGVRASRRDLIWLSYALMSVAAAKILFHDFDRGTMALVVSLLGYGIALILMPRILRKTR